MERFARDAEGEGGGGGDRPALTDAGPACVDPRAELAAAQRRLVAALVAGGQAPAGFDPGLLDAAAAALLRKRSAEVAGAWPELAAGYGPDWPAVFVRWAAGRPPAGGRRDGLDFARTHRSGLPAAAAAELARYEAGWTPDRHGVPRRRRLPAVRRFPGGLVLGWFGHVGVWRNRPGGP